MNLLFAERKFMLKINYIGKKNNFMQELIEQLINEYGISNHEAAGIIKNVFNNTTQKIFLQKACQTGSKIKLENHYLLLSYNYSVSQHPISETHSSSFWKKSHANNIFKNGTK